MKGLVALFFVISTSFGQIPESPGNLLATPVSSSEIRLRWYGSNRGVDFFEIEVFVSSSSQPAIGRVLPHENFEYVFHHEGLTPNTGVNYRVAAVREINGIQYRGFSNIAFATTLVGISNVQEVSSSPKTFRLEQNYPNPFNPATVIDFQLAVGGFTSLTVYNLLGQEVATLVNENLASGKHEATWDASGVASGMYIYRLTSGPQAGGFVQTKRMVLLR